MQDVSAPRAKFAAMISLETLEHVSGVWDSAAELSAVGKVNAWLAANPNFRLADTPRVEARLLEVSKDGARRTFLTTVSLLYFDGSVIKDYRDDVQAQDSPASTVGSTFTPLAGAGEEIRGGPGVDIEEALRELISIARTGRRR